MGLPSRLNHSVTAPHGVWYPNVVPKRARVPTSAHIGKPKAPLLLGFGEWAVQESNLQPWD